MNYLREWKQSCVDEQLVRLNVVAIDGSSPSEYLLYSDALSRRNDGRVSNTILKRYEHTEAGGWWCSGIDLLTGEGDLWGCFKPARPRLSPDRGKLIKYEHPPQAPTGLFALRVPPHLWQSIATRYETDIILREKGQPESDFWQWLLAHPEIPLCITEGAKKAGALLTAGYGAIALPGIHSGYRTPRDGEGKRTGKSHLIPQLQKLATPGREIYLAFDQDSKPATAQAVQAAIRKLGYLLAQAGCLVKVITWHPQLGKGVDDLIASNGQEVFDAAYQKALPLDTWKAQALTRLTYPPQIEVNCRYLPDLSIPETAKLIGIKSPKGTGKTQFLETVVAQTLARHEWVLVLGHRVKLVEELCQRFGLQYVTEIRDKFAREILGYGLCIDSLHPHSQAQFQAANWSGGTVIIDEVEQVLWHALNSDTCRGNRVAILKSLKTLMQNVLGGEGQVFVADANLSDTALDYLISLAGIPLQPFLIQNDWQPSAQEAWQVYNYSENSPEQILRELVTHIREGGKPFVCLSAQKLTSQWGTQTLESYLKEQFPTKKVLRIDSESLTEPNHPACGCLSNLNQVLASWDIVLASPSIETGISIDLRGHFTSVWGIAQGVQSATSVCQALGRIRDNIPRHVWIAAYGFNQVGNGSTSIPALLTSGNRLTELNIRLLQQSDFEAIDDLDTGFQAESLLCWAKMAVRVNASMIDYRDSVLALLQGEGHSIIERSISLSNSPTEGDGKAKGQSFINHGLTAAKESDSQIKNQLTAAINAVREQNYQAECEAIAESENLTDEHYFYLKKRLVKTINERRTLRKYELNRRYGIPVTPELVILDDSGWYQKLRLHYFLTIGKPYLAGRDAKITGNLIEQGNGSLFLPDFNCSQLGVTIGTMEVLGIPVLLANPQRELCKTDGDLQQLAKLAINNRSELKAVMGIGLARNSSPITIIRRLLSRIGYSLTGIGTRRINKKSVRVYQVALPNDGREEVFEQWLLRDRQSPGSSEISLENTRISLQSSARNEREKSSRYLQLSLNL